MLRLLQEMAPSGHVLTDLVRLEILREMTGKQRNREFCFREYYLLFLE